VFRPSGLLHRCLPAFSLRHCRSGGRLPKKPIIVSPLLSWRGVAFSGLLRLPFSPLFFSFRLNPPAREPERSDPQIYRPPILSAPNPHIFSSVSPVAREEGNSIAPAARSAHSLAEQAYENIRFFSSPLRRIRAVERPVEFFICARAKVLRIEFRRPRYSESRLVPATTVRPACLSRTKRSYPSLRSLFLRSVPKFFWPRLSAMSG